VKMGVAPKNYGAVELKLDFNYVQPNVCNGCLELFKKLKQNLIFIICVP